MKQQNNILNKNDGIYNSYWLSKINNIFIKKGKKKKIIKHLNKGLLFIKYTKNINPLIYIFEIIDHLKPAFKLENCFPGKSAVVYPKVVNLSKQYNVAIRWIQLYILENKYNAGRNITEFYKHIIISLDQLTAPKSNLLIKKRNQYHRDAVTLQENVRYTWPKI